MQRARGLPAGRRRAPARCDERLILTLNEPELDLPTFSDLPLRPELLAVVDELGYTQPSPIQAQAIAPLVEGRDLLGQAATGTGKTAAFALPMLQRLAELRPSAAAATRPFGLVLAPTRELALQVSEAVTRYGAGPAAPACSPSTAARPSARSGRRCSRASTSWWPPPAAPST